MKADYDALRAVVRLRTGAGALDFRVFMVALAAERDVQARRARDADTEFRSRQAQGAWKALDDVLEYIETAEDTLQTLETKSRGHPPSS